MKTLQIVIEYLRGQPLQMIATPSTVVDSNVQNVYDEMMEFGDDTD